jgi:tetratricopeptide (TPR) repeat protein
MLTLAYSNRGLVYTARHEYDKAVPALEVAFSLDSGLGLAGYNRADANTLQGKTNAAVADSKKTLELPKNKNTARYARKVLFLPGEG